MTSDKRELAKFLCGSGVSITQACNLVGLGRATFYREPNYVVENIRVNHRLIDDSCAELYSSIV